MTDKPKGIVDPWKRVDPLRAPPRAPRAERIDLQDIDFDADLVIPGQYLIKSEYASVNVIHVRVQQPADALDVLADCIVDAWTDKAISQAMLGANVGVRGHGGMRNVPDEHTAASLLRGGECAIWFIGETVDRGMLALVRVLRLPGAARAIKKWGITPMTK